MALSYKVFPGTPYYSNTSLTTKAGEIVNTTAATYVNTTYGTVSVGGSTYYVAYGMMVSFWNSSFTGAQIDDALNKVINADTTPTANSTKMITSGGVKSALDAKADQTDLASIHATGSTNTTGAKITAGWYFYLNDVLARAKTDIAVNATFTNGTNYETVTAGGLNAIAPVTIGAAYLRSYYLISNAIVYLNHDGFVLLCTDRGGMWTEGPSNRALTTISSTTETIVTRSSATKLQIKSNSGGATYVVAFSDAPMSFTSS